jgi:hypothetical protein
MCKYFVTYIFMSYCMIFLIGTNCTIIKCDRSSGIIESLHCDNRIDCNTKGLINYKPDNIFIELFNSTSIIISDKQMTISQSFPIEISLNNIGTQYLLNIAQILCSIDKKRISSFNKKVQTMEKIRSLDEYYINNDHPGYNTRTMLLITSIFNGVSLILNIYIVLKWNNNP